MLWQLYGDEVEEDAQADEKLPLTSFQKHGVARALRLIRDTGGVIVADEVGLGKTFIAGEILQIYQEQRQRALLICPAALRDSTWSKFLTNYQLFVECLSFEQLANDKQLRDRQRPNADQQHLQRPLDEYQIVSSLTKPTITATQMRRHELPHYGGFSLAEGEIFSC